MANFFQRVRAFLSTPRGRWAAIGGGVVAVILMIGVGAVALGGGGGDDTTTSTSATSQGTTAPDTTGTTAIAGPETSTGVTATTIVAEGFSLALEDAPEGFDQAVAGLYLWAGGLTEDLPPSVAEGLAAHLEGIEPVQALDLQGTVAWAELRDRGRVAVATIADDVVLGADEGAGWEIVGASLASLDRDPWYGGSPRTVLIIGSDANWQEDIFKKNGDSIQILTADLETGGGAIVGIPRDAWVEVGDGSSNKFTNVLPAGGAEGMLEVARSLTGLDIEGYLITGFLGFEQLARNLNDGLTVDLPQPVRGGSGPGATPGFPDFPAGTQTLSAEDLLLYLRIRKTLPNGDLDRVANAGTVTARVLDVAQGRGYEDLPLMLSILAASTHSDLSAGQLLTLGATALDLDPDLIDRVVAPGTPGEVGAASVVFLDPGAAVIFADIGDGRLDGG